MSYNLEKYNLTELRKMAREMELPSRRSKTEMIDSISAAFREYEDYYKEKIAKYTRVKRLGNKGKEGITYLVTDENGNEYAMKTFRKGKSSTTLRREYRLQREAAKLGISPMVKDYDTVSKYIVMDRMECHLLDVMRKQKGDLRRYQQKRILEIFDKLDQAKVFHGDANLANYMMVGKQIYIIDFGFAKEIDSRLTRKLGTNSPNKALMLLGFVMKLRDMNCPPSAYKHLLPHIPAGDREKFGLNN
jgi:predicted Ser/Thr protein kinase